MSTQKTLEGAWLLGEIQQRGYAEFEHGIPSETIDNLVSCYADFTLSHPDPEFETMDAMIPSSPSEEDAQNPAYYDKDGVFLMNKWLAKQLDELDRGRDKQKAWHKYRTNVVGIGKPDGYSNRSFAAEAVNVVRGSVVIEDPKEFYHFTPVHYGNMARAHQEYDWGHIPPEVATLNTAFEEVHARASQLMTRICALVEEVHPEVSQIITPESLKTSPVRLLFYHPSNSEQLGAGHYDKSFSTLQIAESHEGLRLATKASQPLEGVVREANKAVFFPGRGGLNLIDKNTPFKPGWHDIIKVDRLNPGRHIPLSATEVCARYAVIFFANGANFVNPDKALMHSR